MRVSTGQLQQLMMDGMDRSTGEFARISQQMAAKKRILKPSDDPLGSVQLMSLQKEQANLKQYDANIDSSRRHLGSAETYITSISDTLLRLRDLTLEAGNGAYGQSERQALAREMRSLKETLVDTANAKGSNGKYLFSGSEVDKAPVSDPVAGVYQYQGDNAVRQVSISSGVQVATNVDLEQVFFHGGDDFFQGLDSFIDELETSPDGVNADMVVMLDKIDTSMGSNLELLTTVGAKINTLEQVENTNADITLYSKKLQMSLESLNFGQAAMDLSQAELAMNCTQQVYIKVNRLSLFNQM